MSLDFADAYNWIVEEFSMNRSPAEAMARLIERCAAAHPHSHWARLQELPYGDMSSLSEWIERPLRDSPPADSLQGLSFGLFNPVYDNETVGDLYICGSNRFDPQATDGEWAVHPAWWPEDRYAHSEIMAAIYRIAYDNGGLGNNAEYPLCLGFGAFAVRELLNSLDPALVPATINSVGVGVGFDSGDALVLGRFTREGLRPVLADS